MAVDGERGMMPVSVPGQGRSRSEREPQVTSVRLPGELRERLDGLAGVFGRPRNDVVIAALERYVDEGWLLFADVEEGRRDVQAGRVVSLEDVWTRLRAGKLISPLDAE